VADARPPADEYAFLRDPPVAAPGPTADGRAVGWLRRRRTLALGLLTIVTVVAATAAARLTSREPESADVTIHSVPPTATVALISRSPVPPARGAPFPIASGAGALRRSGGPYLSRSRISAVVLAHLECTLGKARRNMPGFACARVDVAFFDRYADAWSLRGASWVKVSEWAADREMYVVTVWGHLMSEPKSALTEITTVEIDATTGRTMMEGGPPLPAADANR
jgi:hypothetical protein